jgi:hypothetical protein
MSEGARTSGCVRGGFIAAMCVQRRMRVPDTAFFMTTSIDIKNYPC